MGRLDVNLCGIQLDNPVIPASGTFGYGYEFAKFYDINKLGTFSFKGTTKEARFGNPTPRIAECSAGMLNSVGLQNKGVEKVITEELPKLKKCFSKKVMANISGFSEEEYVYVCEKLNKCDEIGWFEINISCPNVHGGGMAFGTNVKDVERITKSVKKVSKKPIIMKLSPNVSNISEIAKVCENAGADGLSLINTVMGMEIDIAKRKPVLANKTGGYSGRGIFPIALRMVSEVSKNVKIPIIGMGGISSAEDVIKMIMAGATAVEIGSYNLINPYGSLEIIEELPKVMDKYGIDSLKDIKGIAL